MYINLKNIFLLIFITFPGLEIPFIHHIQVFHEFFHTQDCEKLGSLAD